MKANGSLLFSVLVLTCLSGCIIADVVETAVEVPIAVVEGAVDVTTSVVGVVADLPPEFTATCKTEQEWTFEGEDIGLISVDTRNGFIEVKGGETDTINVKSCITVHARRKSTAECYADQVHVNLERNSGELCIYKDSPPSSSKHRLSISYVIETPINMDLNLRTSNGKIRVHYLQGNVEADTSNGRIEVKHLAGSLKAKTNNGTISSDFEKMDRATDLRTSNGRIEVVVREGIAPIEAHTSNGSIELILHDYFGGKLDAKTSNGSVNTKFPLLLQYMKKKHIVGLLNNQEDPTIVLRTSNGSIHLHKLNTPKKETAAL